MIRIVLRPAAEVDREEAGGMVREGFGGGIA
jgi:hypothetical protein